MLLVPILFMHVWWYLSSSRMSGMLSSLLMTMSHIILCSAPLLIYSLFADLLPVFLLLLVEMIIIQSTKAIQFLKASEFLLEILL